VLPLQRKRIRDARDGCGDIGRVQRREHEMACLCRGQGNAHRFGVAHLADYENVRSLPQCGTQRRRKVFGIGSNLNLLKNRLHMSVLVFDGIFNCDNMTRLAAINFMNQSGERCGFS
jgi:hypothetical protein